jgi:Pyruvate/2-oxoacid:ferredoxin oxidoreductase gamma subunit
MGSGGGVPDHATYVTQKIGSGWYVQVYEFYGQSQSFVVFKTEVRTSHR